MKKTVGLDISVDQADISTQPLRFSIVADQAERSATAARFDLLDVNALTADLAISYDSAAKALLIEGQLKADIVQRCVLSLDPVPDQIDESFDLLLVDEATAEAWDEEERYLEPDQRDYDVFEGESVPLGEIVAQTLSILMNDYPRADGASLEGLPDGVEIDGPERENPFAALAELQKKS